ncbi:DUF2391 family protein [Seonamhaeicola maritimus]|uniref:DUF2391 family protein n=1 Tax=Seonamhaeicola maritimus TaxID=2591822 RepID=A0A5C7GF47_9FLAO|nr:DUF2391 family protein [Seonamhaeicola maritimus]TXG35776.1 DUF2391 family protein [Seonamhaeicola maritimus]
MEQKVEIKETTIKRIGGYLHRVVPIADKSGEIISYALKPLMLEFKPRDIMQVIIGSAILAIPVSLTEEAWNLGETLPISNVSMIAAISLVLISVFVYFNFYKVTLKGYVTDFIKRIIGTYIISLLVVALILTLIDKCPWRIDNLLAIKRIIIVAFPAAMSGTLSDTIK